MSPRAKRRFMARSRSSPHGGRSGPVLNAAVQDVHIRHRFPTFRYARERAEAVWRGTLRPSVISPTYRVIVRYRHGKSPKVTIEWPSLAPDAPHVYRGGSLCLYWPREWNWKPDELIASTILPWAALWLHHYELWLDGGVWLGPSSHDPMFISPRDDEDAA